MDIRNLCDEGDTPAFRPNSGRKSPWAFSGGEKFRNLVETADNWGGNSGEGLYPEPDAWLKQCKPDIILAFFGFKESFDGIAGLPNFKAELEAFIDHTSKQTYNDKAAPQLVLISPTAFQDLSAQYGTPNGITQNANLALYSEPMEDVAAADSKTETLVNMGEKDESIKYLSSNESLKTMVVPQGYKVELFADETKFPDLANPVQLSFDNKGRLWVAVMPVYPHYRPGDPLPNDKLIILKDTNGDGRADQQITFADRLHLPMGFEFSHDGVYVAQGNSLTFYKDTDGDDKADVKDIVMSGFDDHDTHHAISAFCADPSGAILMAEGTFFRSHIETAYGPIRSSNGGFSRYNPERRRLERTARISVPNPWGIAFDHWEQDFFADTSDPNVR